MYVFGAVLFLLLVFGVYGFFKPGPVDDAHFKETIAGMETMVTQLEAGNIKEAEKVFNGVHGFFHDVDPSLRKKDPQLAKELWDVVTLIEGQWGTYQPDSAELMNKAKITITLLQKAREKLT